MPWIWWSPLRPCTSSRAGPMASGPRLSCSTWSLRSSASSVWLPICHCAVRLRRDRSESPAVPPARAELLRQASGSDWPACSSPRLRRRGQRPSSSRRPCRSPSASGAAAGSSRRHQGASCCRPGLLHCTSQWSRLPWVSSSPRAVSEVARWGVSASGRAAASTFRSTAMRGNGPRATAASELPSRRSALRATPASRLGSSCSWASPRSWVSRASRSGAEPGVALPGEADGPVGWGAREVGGQRSCRSARALPSSRVALPRSAAGAWGHQGRGSKDCSRLSSFSRHWSASRCRWPLLSRRAAPASASRL
jgi:hypothetical protein